MADLKPCPFCGMKPVIENLFIYGGYVYRPHCDVCECVIHRWFPSEKEAVREWNRRADNAGN